MTDVSPRKSAKISDGKRADRVDEAAARLRVCKDTIYSLIKNGTLRSVKIGKIRLITNVDEVLNGDIAA